jgi:lipopolysaccharide transport system ATP-binding protein
VMSNVAIRIENLGKRYKIGVKREKYYTLRDSLMNALTYPFRRRPPETADNPHPQEDFIWALKDVSLEINHGDIVGIIGRNGAGKSTLLKILSRITEPTEGQAELFGRVGSLLEVGTGFHPELTGRENIFLNGVIMGMTRAEVQRNFDAIVAFAEIEKFLDTPVKHYSSGMYVRLAFAVAAHLDPEILLVDEVLAVGDASFQKKCLGKMEDVAKGGRTVLFVSHNMGAVRALCQRCILLENGAVTATGETEATVEKYQKKIFGSLGSESQDHSRRTRSDCTGRVLIRAGSVTVPRQWRDPFRITFKYEVMECIERFSIEWFIRDAYGARVMSGLSALAEEIWFIPGDSNAGEIKSTVREWRLPGGRHSLCAYISNPSIECIDYIEDLIIFDVPEMVPGKPGFIFLPKYGWLLPEINWESDKNTKIESNRK